MPRLAAFTAPLLTFLLLAIPLAAADGPDGASADEQDGCPFTPKEVEDTDYYVGRDNRGYVTVYVDPNDLGGSEIRVPPPAGPVQAGVAYDLNCVEDLLKTAVPPL